MKTSTKVLLGLVLVLAAVFYLFVSGYNKMVTSEELVDAEWSQVETQYQRRADLIPNLVSTVKGYAAHESQTLTQVVEARAKATSVQINADQLDEATLKQFQAAQTGLSQALGKLLVSVERYPDLKANQNFLQLQAQLEGTENRITVARNRFNDIAKGYNTMIRRFPNSLIAGMTGFERKPYFQSDETASQAPKVEF